MNSLKIRKVLLKLPIPAKFHYLMQIGGRLHGAVVKYSPEGKILRILEDRRGKVVRAVSEVEEKDGKLWIGSVLMPFIAVYQLE
ncbi:Strictosidine synthase [Handroanthus impetiginosus]|uniref:Strictosidine synthase n=1 Tax=Handroanthus impetiginosus TaxID=429701 RepID=A0A2G9GPW2_9LAMI|nr:Strictosidine synthase [Handroanthus impetiginosus]